ncbi:MAG: tetratricopeptide repeat protein, partial [Planctomycetaceae bacterium]|nr:tetratricopeptide repeat protein [Planctomycetaceae bacterium]
MKARMLWAATLALSIAACGCQTLNENLFGRFSRQSNGRTAEAVAMNNPIAAATAQPQLNNSAFSRNDSPPPMAAGRADQLLSDGQRAVQRGDLDTARKLFSEVLEGAPSDPTAHHGLAIVADLDQQWQEAQYHYQQALRSRPRDPALLGDLGYSYLLQHRDYEASRYLNQAIEIQPDHQVAYVHLAMLSLRQGDRQQAETWLRRTFSPQQIPQYLAQLEHQLNETDRTPAPNAETQVAGTANRVAPYERTGQQPAGAPTTSPASWQGMPFDHVRQLAQQQRTTAEGPGMTETPSVIQPPAWGPGSSNLMPGSTLSGGIPTATAGLQQANAIGNGSELQQRFGQSGQNSSGIVPNSTQFDQQPVHVYPEHVHRLIQQRNQSTQASFGQNQYAPMPVNPGAQQDHAAQYSAAAPYGPLQTDTRQPVMVTGQAGTETSYGSGTLSGPETQYGPGMPTGSETQYGPGTQYVPGTSNGPEAYYGRGTEFLPGRPDDNSAPTIRPLGALRESGLSNGLSADASGRPISQPTTGLSVHASRAVGTDHVLSENAQYPGEQQASWTDLPDRPRPGAQAALWTQGTNAGRIPPMVAPPIDIPR